MTPDTQTGQHPQNHQGAYEETPSARAFISINQKLSGNADKDSKLSTSSTPSKKPQHSVAIVNYFDSPPSEEGGNINLPEPRVPISRARQLRKNPPSDAAPVLALWSEATSISVLYGNRAVPSQVWLDLTDAMTSVASTMTVSDVSELLKLLATALHRCGRRLNPNAISLAALAHGARAALKSREHTTDELLEFQSAVADVLRVVALGGAAGTRSVERREWGQAMATKLLPLLAVGTAAIYATYKTVSSFFIPSTEDELKSTTSLSSEQTVQNALFFAEALATIAWCPTTIVSTEKLDQRQSGKISKRKGATSSSSPSSSSTTNGLWKRFFCFMPSVTNTVSPINTTITTTAATTTTTATTTSALYPTMPSSPDTLTTSILPSYSQLLSKITSRSVAIATWLQQTVAPIALDHMTLQELDIFTASLVTAAGDDGKIHNSNKINVNSYKYDDSASESNGENDTSSSSKNSDKKMLIRDIFVRCAGDAIEEAARRVINASAGSYHSAASNSTNSSSSSSSNGGDSPPNTPAHAVGNGVVSSFAVSSSPGGCSKSVEAVDIDSARRMAATARRNWEAAASVHSPKAADVANFARVLENYVAAKEDEEDAAVQAEIAAAAAARLELSSN